MFNFNSNYFSHKDINKDNINDNSSLIKDENFLIKDELEKQNLKLDLEIQNLKSELKKQSLKSELDIQNLKLELEKQSLKSGLEIQNLKSELEKQYLEQITILKEEINMLKDNLTKINNKNTILNKQILKINEKISSLETKGNNSSSLFKNLTQEQMDDLKRQEYTEKYNLLRRKTILPFAPILSNDLLFYGKVNEFKKK